MQYDTIVVKPEAEPPTFLLPSVDSKNKNKTNQLVIPSYITSSGIQKTLCVVHSLSLSFEQFHSFAQFQSFIQALIRFIILLALIYRRVYC